MKLEQFIHDRVQKIAFMIEISAKKIVKKEINRIKKDLKKELLNKLK